MSEHLPISPSIYVAAFLLSLVNVVLIWAMVMYPVTAIFGETMHLYFHVLTGTILFFILCFWALYDSENGSEVVYRNCKLGAILSLMLPLITAVISFLWATGGIDRPGGFLTGYSALEIPVYTTGISMILILLFFTGSYLAARQMDGIPF